jgi:hypothetical protein
MDAQLTILDAQLTMDLDELLMQGDRMLGLVPFVKLDVKVEWETTDSDAIDDERLDNIQDFLAEVHRIIDGSRSSYISGGTTPKKCYMGCVFSTAVTVTTIRELMLQKLKTITYEVTVKVMNAEGRKLNFFPVVPPPRL